MNFRFLNPRTYADALLETRQEIDKMAAAQGGGLRYEPNPLLNVNVHLAEHCNLACKHCLHLSPLSKVQLLDLTEYQKDLARLAELFSERVQLIQLSGGEPLLHPKADQAVRLTRKYLPRSRITIISNGILLKKQPEHFFEALRETGADLRISRYPISLDYDELQRFAKEKGVFLETVYDGPATEFIFEPFDTTGMQDPRLSFRRCSLANSCIHLHNHRLYTCVRIPSAPLLNEAFGTHLVETDVDGIDIFGKTSADEIMAFLAKPVPFCRYCVPVQRKTVQWGPSKKSLEEWALPCPLPER